MFPIYVRAITAALAAVLLGTAPATTVPATQPASRLQILKTDGAYVCILRVPLSTAVNETIGFVLRIQDRQSRDLGTVRLYENKIENDRWLECRLSPELIKTSKIIYQINPNTDAVQAITLTLGDTPSSHLLNGKLVYEPIP